MKKTFRENIFIIEKEELQRMESLLEKSSIPNPSEYKLWRNLVPKLSKICLDSLSKSDTVHQSFKKENSRLIKSFEKLQLENEKLREEIQGRENLNTQAINEVASSLNVKVMSKIFL